MRIERFEAAGIDFDGTIANTRAAMTESRLAAFNSIADEIDDERYARIDPAVHAEAHHHGTHPLEIIGWVMLQAGIINDIHSGVDEIQLVVDRRNEIYWTKAALGFDAIDGAVDTLLMLHERLDSNLNIVTTAPLDNEVLPFLRRHKLQDLFGPEQLITRNDVTALKPDPEAYLLSIRRTGADPEKYLALEDAHGGIRAARLARIGEVAALATTHPVEYFDTMDDLERPTIVTPTHADFQKVFFS